VAILETVDDEAGRVAVPSAGFHLVAGQERWPGRLDRAIGVQLNLTTDGFLQHHQGSFTIGWQ
jgi:hypothetical protein